ncbi:hypothetical protein HaLaN_14470, partial [Haematococcus lacustris]
MGLPPDKEWYQSSLGSAEASGDWVKTLEVLTEVRVLDIPLPDAALEEAKPAALQMS